MDMRDDLAGAVREAQAGSAAVGSRDGDAAPYLFLLIEPFPPIPEGAQGAEAGKGDVTLPKILEKTNPAYPDEARRARLEGVVLLQITVGPSGRVTDVKVLRGEPMGLSEAAVAAVNQWRWEPARNSKGEAVTVMMTLTIRFALR